MKILENGTIKAIWEDLDRFDEKSNKYIYFAKEVNKTWDPDPVPIPDQDPDPEPTPEPDPIIPG